MFLFFLPALPNDSCVSSYGIVVVRSVRVPELLKMIGLFDLQRIRNEFENESMSVLIRRLGVALLV